MSEFTIEAPALRTALTTALSFTMNDDPHPVLECVNLKPVEGAIEFGATDRFTLYWEQVKVTGEPYALLIPAHIARRLLTMLPKGTRRKPLTGMVSFARDDGRVTARFIGEFEEFETAITFTPPDYEGFPDYQKMLDGFAEIDPAKHVSAVHVNPNYLARVSKALAARRFFNEPVEMSFLTATKPVRLTSPDGFNAIVMPVRMHEEREAGR